MFKISERSELFVLDTKDACLNLGEDIFLESAAKAIQERGRAVIALAGGSTPKALYERLLAKKEAIDWSKVFLFFSDERCVPLDHPDSNFKMAWESAFHELVPRSHIYPMYTSSDVEKAALDYEKELAPFLPLDLVMLGMGEDAHTASLFPFTHALHAENRHVVANFIPEKEIWRLTFTYECINSSRTILMFVLGASKKEALAKVFNGPYQPDALPAQRVGTRENKAIWIVDRAAAEKLD